MAKAAFQSIIAPRGPRFSDPSALIDAAVVSKPLAVRLRCAVKGTDPQRVKIPSGNCRSSR